MEPEILVLWLTLLGQDPGAQPSAAVPSTLSAREIPTGAWVGEWLAGGERRPLRASLLRVPGRRELASKITFGEGAHAVVEHWVARPDGRWLTITQTGTGSGRFTTTENGDLVGRLTRHGVAGDVKLLRVPPER